MPILLLDTFGDSPQRAAQIQVSSADCTSEPPRLKDSTVSPGCEFYVGTQNGGHNFSGWMFVHSFGKIPSLPLNDEAHLTRGLQEETDLPGTLPQLPWRRGRKAIPS